MRGLKIEEGSIVGETYRVVRLIGSGGMGEVWQAEHMRLPGLQVAIKFLFGDSVDHENFERFQREALIMASLHHPHITRIIDLNQRSDSTPYIVLEYLEGESLSTRLEQGVMSLSEVTHVLQQVGSALQATHSSGIIHRDLKPDNIFLCVSPNSPLPHTKVLDFGVSKVRGVEKITLHQRGFLGTPQYMSPEQAMGDDNVDHRADQFALAIILYEMLVGQPPFMGEQIMQVLTKIVHAEPVYIKEHLSSLPDRAAQALHKALSKTPSDRFASCDEFISSFIAALSEDQREDDWDLESKTEVVDAHYMSNEQYSTEIDQALDVEDLHSHTIPMAFDEMKHIVQTDPEAQSITPSLPQPFSSNSSLPSQQQKFSPSMTPAISESSPSSSTDHHASFSVMNAHFNQSAPKFEYASAAQFAQSPQSPSKYEPPPSQFHSPKKKTSLGKIALFLMALSGLSLFAWYLFSPSQVFSVQAHSRYLNSSALLSSPTITSAGDQLISTLKLTNRSVKALIKMHKSKSLRKTEQHFKVPSKMKLIIEVNKTIWREQFKKRGELVVYWIGPEEVEIQSTFKRVKTSPKSETFWLKTDHKFSKRAHGRWTANIMQANQLMGYISLELKQR